METGKFTATVGGEKDRFHAQIFYKMVNVADCRNFIYNWQQEKYIIIA